MASQDHQPRDQELGEDLPQILKDLCSRDLQGADSVLDNTTVRQILTSMSGIEVAIAMIQTLLADPDADLNDYRLVSTIRKLIKIRFFTHWNGMEACELFMTLQRLFNGETQGEHLTNMLEWALAD